MHAFLQAIRDEPRPVGRTRMGVLVDTGWLAEHLDDPVLRIVEVDEDTSAYERGHIPNAVAWNWRTDLQTRQRRDYIDQGGLAALLGCSGVDHATTVVLYGGNDNWFAAYAYWLLRYRGFDQVQLLSGGRRKWELEARPLVTDVPSFPVTAVRLDTPDRSQLRALRDTVLARLDTARFVDVRTPEEYRGEITAPPHLPQERAQIAGHIPGAANIPWSCAVNADGTFKSVEELRTLYEQAGVTAEHPVITYCRIGERSAHSWFVLHELLGYPSVANYDGSWTEYGSLVGVRVERSGIVDR
jgi:thiosulfate/3-mercaptopyruvate sulfurtransferase